MKNLTSDQFDSLVNAIRRQEGWKAGTVAKTTAPPKPAAPASTQNGA
jgi:hypothetical protein